MENLNRSIKFRAWDGLGKKMYKVSLINIKEDWVGIKKYNKYIVMQYTGLRDKNGKEIYEGDIIEHGKYAYSPFENSISEVYWFEENFAYYFRKKHIKTSDNDKQIWDSEKLGNISGGVDDKFEIIGNIYENTDIINKRLTTIKN